MKTTEILFPKRLKQEILYTGGSVLLIFAFLLILISIVWGWGIVTRARDQQWHELSSIANSLSAMIREAESHVYQMKSHAERERIGGTSLTLKGSSPFDTDTTVPFTFYQHSSINSDTALAIEEALSLMDFAISAHATDSTYQWSYFYDANEKFMAFYPKVTSDEDMISTNTSNHDAMLSAIFSADSTFPVRMVSPKRNPEGKLQWTVPYEDAGGAGMMVSILAPVFQNSRYIGVVGTDITLEKIRRFILSQKTDIMNIEIIDSEGKPIVATCDGTHSKYSYFYSKNLPVNGWKITGEIERFALIKTLFPIFLIPIIILSITMTAFVVAVILFILRFVYPSLTLAGFIVASSKKKDIPTPRAVPTAWREFFQQVVDGLTERSKLNEQLHQSQKLEAIGQLAGGVAHDFNNALAGIMGATELLKMDDTLTDEQTVCLDLILTASEQARDLTKKLLLFSRKADAVRDVVNCAKIVSDTASLLKYTVNKNIEISIDNRSLSADVYGDSSLLQNALMNMGINASHAMPNGGELTFTLENLVLGSEFCEISPFEIQPGQYLEISIRDTGTGMSPETQSRMFEPFFTTKEAGKGTGLGMAAVYGTVTEHSGAITVYSELGTGTVFRVYLPLSEEFQSSDEQEDNLPKGTGTILVIDDEELVRTTTRLLLMNLGYTVIQAENGLQGVQIFTEKSDQIDLVILDMIMPVMGGREAFEHIRQKSAEIPVIIASGFAKEEEMEALKKYGVSNFLNKPFRKDELAEMVAKVRANSTVHKRGSR